MDAATKNGVGLGVWAVVDYDYTAKEPDELDLVKGAIIHSIKQMPGGWWEGTLQSNGKTGMFPDNFVRVMRDDNTVTLRDKSVASNRRCKVIYSYTQVNDDELTLGVGDVIEFLGEVEEGWWRGRLRNKIGVFPSNFVVSIEPSPVLASKRPTTGGMITTNTAAAASTSSSSTTTTSSLSTLKTINQSTINATSHLTAAETKTNRISFHNSKEDLLSSSHASNIYPTLSNSAATSTMSTGTTAGAGPDEVAPRLPPKPQREFCRVEFPYAPQNDDELELKTGDVIAVISTELPDKGWWKGELRGKVGVFPDNFVKLLPPSEVSPLNEPQQAQRAAKNINALGNTSSTAHLTTSSTISSTTASATSIPNSTTTTTGTSKVFIKKSGSSASNRKDSFGSRDSLNDILSETGLQTGNVAAQRRSLENKNLELSNPVEANVRLGLKKQQLQESKTIVNSNNVSSSNSNNSNSATTTTANTTLITTTTIVSSNSASTSELRKSMENMSDEKVKTPPPVLTKKPSVPTKKSTTVTSVAGNIFSGLKQKVKNVENKLTTAASQDSADGVGSSKMTAGGLPDAGASGNVVMRRAATIAVEDTDFDRVERGSILTDMRAGRAKAPKRRPPSTATAINISGESNNSSSNNNSVYLNGSDISGSSIDHSLLHSDESKLQSSDDNSTGEEQLVKPKQREWEKKKAPWMEELKASQVKKKTPTSVELQETKSSNHSAISSTSSVSTNAATNTNANATVTKLQSSSISSSVIQQSMIVESSTSTNSTSSSQLLKTSSATSSANDNAMAKSMTSGISTAMSNLATDDVRVRPNSLSIRNRSTSPAKASSSARNTLKTSAVSAAPATASTTNTNSAEVVSNNSSNNLHSSNSYIATSTTTSTAATKPPTIVNNHHENNIPSGSSANKTSSNDAALRVIDLERRVEKLEAVVHSQQRTIDELVRALREENDRVKVLRGELDKYAQCVTQV